MRSFGRWGLPGVYIAAVACLPFMDWPYMLGLSSYVRPLALFPVLLGCGLVALGLLAGPRRRLVVSLPFCLFLAFAVWAVLLSPLLMVVDPGAEAVKGQAPMDRYQREALGLLAGLATYAYFTVVVRHWWQGMATVRIVLMVFPVVLAAVLIQAGWLFLGIDALRMVDHHVLGLVQSRHALFKASGLTPEASMLADQLTTTVIPFSLAGLALRHSVFRRRPLGASVELWMLLGAVIALLFTTSRVGLMVFVLLFLAARVYQMPKRRLGRRQRRYLVLLPLLVGLLLVAYPGTRAKLAEVAFSIRGVAASADAGIWSNVTRLGTQVAGYRMFAAHPLGVGTGGFAYHFADYVPAWALISPEIQAFLGWSSPDTAYCGGACGRLVADPKGFGARIAAENGIVGVGLIGAMFILLVRRSWRTYRDAPEPALRHLALGCLLSLSAMLVLSFNQSSFLWVHWYLVFALAGALPRHRLVAAHRAYAHRAQDPRAFPFPLRPAGIGRSR